MQRRMILESSVTEAVLDNSIMLLRYITVCLISSAVILIVSSLAMSQLCRGVHYMLSRI